MVWPCLPAVVVERVMAVWGVSWQNYKQKFDALPHDNFCWERKDESSRKIVTHLHVPSFNFQLLVLSKLPHLVERAEAEDQLPGAGEHTVSCTHF